MDEQAEKVNELIRSVQYSQRERSEAEAEAKKWDALASKARIRANRALHQELSDLSRLDEFDLTEEQFESMGL